MHRFPLPSLRRSLVPPSLFFVSSPLIGEDDDDAIRGADGDADEGDEGRETQNIQITMIAPGDKKGREGVTNEGQKRPTSSHNLSRGGGRGGGVEDENDIVSGALALNRNRRIEFSLSLSRLSTPDAMRALRCSLAALLHKQA